MPLHGVITTPSHASRYALLRHFDVAAPLSCFDVLMRAFSAFVMPLRY